MYRYFKCNVLGGFRLSDLNRSVKQNECIQIDSTFCETSRSVRAALGTWMFEIDEKEYLDYQNRSVLQLKTRIENRNVPVNGLVKGANINSGGVQEVGLSQRRMLNVVNKVAPDVKTTNISLESRQTERAIRRKVVSKQKQEDKPALPNFNQAEQNIRSRQADVMTKGPDETLRSPVETKNTLVKSDVTCVVNDIVKDMIEKTYDNSLLATPSFENTEGMSIVSQELKNSSESIVNADTVKKENFEVKKKRGFQKKTIMQQVG